MRDRPGGIRAGVRRLFRLAVRRPDIVHDDMDDELRFHFDERVEYFVARGMSRDDARVEALRRLGGDLPGTRERLRNSADHRERTMAMHERFEEIVQDIRYAARGLVRRPGFTTIAILTLAVGIGANTAIFSAVNAMMFRPLPFRDPSQLMNVSLAIPASDGHPARNDMPWSWMKYLAFRDAQRQFQDHALWEQAQLGITGEDPEKVLGEWASSRYMTTLGIAPALGRGFEPDGDDTFASRKVAMISNDLWKRRFNADPRVLGHTIDIERSSYEIVGVLPPGFHGLSGAAEVIIPISTQSIENIGPAQAWSHEFQMIARLKPGITAAQAVAAAPTIAAAINVAYPGSDHSPAWTVNAVSLDATRVSPRIRQSLLILFASVSLVLLIACVNLANLLLGRASARRQEIAIRLALGAGRARIVRLLMAESLLLALVGGMASVFVALLGTRALASANPAETLRVQNLSGLGVSGFASIHLDMSALLFTLVTSIVVGILFGLVPAMQATRFAVAHDMKSGGSARTAGGRHRITSRHTLVVTEVALAIVLLVGSGLMIRSLANLLSVDAGFDSSNLLTLRLQAPREDIPRDSLPGFYDRLLERLGGLPGVSSVALADGAPLEGGGGRTIITFPDRPPVPQNQAPPIGVHVVTPSWFGTLRVPLKRGRLLTDQDRIGTPKSIVINETAAKRYWPGEDPIGKRAGIWQGGFDDGATVVGIVGDVRYLTIDSVPRPDVYMSYEQSPRARMMIVVRTNHEPLVLAPAVRRAIGELLPGVPLYDIKSMATRTAAASAQARFSAVLLGLFAATALALAVIGIYGVMSFMVVQRTREIGIRMALGADRRQVQRLVIAEGLWLAGIGAALGVVAAIGLTRVMGSLLFDVKPGDSATYVSIVALLGIAAAIASWIPARRAAKVEPTEALRAS